MLKMLTDWPDSSRLYDADVHHVIDPRPLHINELQIRVMCARDHMEKLTDETFQKAIKVGLRYTFLLMRI